MAADASFAEQLLQAAEGKQTTTPSSIRSMNANKRKRPAADQGSPGLRATPNTRRSRLQQQDHGQTATPVAGLSDADFASQQQAADGPSSSPFDFGSLQSTGTTANMSNSDASTAAAALKYSMTVPPHPAQSFINEPTAGEAGYDVGADFGLEGGDASAETSPVQTQGASHLHGSSAASKPSVGTEEWHKLRKDNHKEVERRRRETINEGINELAKIVPGSEKNKGSILARAVQYITKLHDDATQNIDKWTFEKLVTEQAIADLSSKVQRAWAEKEAWKRVAREAGVDVENVDLGLDNRAGGKDGAVASAAEGEDGDQDEGKDDDDDDAEDGNGDANGERLADA